jgi:lipopolysaccharide heptosyltransferase II
MKILIRAANWLGDAVMAIPALEAVRGHWRSDEIVILARPGVAELYREQDFADRVVIFDDTGRHAGISGREKLASELRHEKYDLALLLQNAFEAAWIAWRAGIPRRIGYARDARAFLLTQALEVPGRRDAPAHESYYYLELLRRAGLISELPQISRIELKIAMGARERAEDVLLRAGARRGAIRVAMGPGARYGTAKCWPAARFADVADELSADFDCDVILFGTATEKAIAQRIASRMRSKAILLAGETALADVPALLASCQLFIGNDSGAMHVAAAVGLPVVAIFGPTDPAGTSPVTRSLELIQHPVSCSPCFLRECPVDHRCMTRIESGLVAAAARRWIEELSGANSRSSGSV